MGLGVSLVQWLFPSLDNKGLDYASKNMERFYLESAKNIQRAIVETNFKYSNYGPIYFALPKFSPENAIYASNPWVYELVRKNIREFDEAPFSSTDPVKDLIRAAECWKNKGFSDYAKCRIAGFLHPNEKGHAEFANKIIEKLKGIDLSYTNR